MISNRVRRFGSMTAVSGETPGQRRRDRHLIVNITIRTTTTVGRTLYFGAVNGNRGVVVWWLRERPDGSFVVISRSMAPAVSGRLTAHELGHLRYDCDGCQRTHWVGRLRCGL